MYYVYILQSQEHPFLYVGSTTDLKRRFIEHNAGLSLSTKPYLPFIVASYIAVPTLIQARKLEEYFKTGSGKVILKKRILNNIKISEFEVLTDL